MRVNIRDVAEAAGVSIKTVSRVLNHEASVKLSTRQRILALAEKMNYKPDPSARSLAGKKSYLLGFLYDNPSSSYLMEILTGVLGACKANHYGLTLCPLQHRDAGFVGAVEEIVRSSKLDGLILTPPISDSSELLGVLDQLEVRYACISPRDATNRIGVQMDEQTAVQEIVAHLVSLGHTRIAHIKGHPSHSASHWRLSGYQRGLLGAGLAFDPRLVCEGYFTFESGRDSTKWLLALPDPPTAIFAGNDDTAAGVMSVLHERGLRIPADISVCGFDNLPVSRQIFPALTTVSQPTAAMGKIATEQLLSHIKDRSAGTMVNVPYELILRQSTGPRRDQNR